MSSTVTFSGHSLGPGLWVTLGSDGVSAAFGLMRLKHGSPPSQELSLLPRGHLKNGEVGVLSSQSAVSPLGVTKYHPLSL